MGAVTAYSELSPHDLEDRPYSIKETRRYLPLGVNVLYAAAGAYIDRIDKWQAAHGFLVPADVLAPRYNEIPAVRQGGRMLVKGLLLRQKLCGVERVQEKPNRTEALATALSVLEAES
jgi:hypothetical protein